MSPAWVSGHEAKVRGVVATYDLVGPQRRVDVRLRPVDGEALPRGRSGRGECGEPLLGHERGQVLAVVLEEGDSARLDVLVRLLDRAHADLELLAAPSKE